MKKILVVGASGNVGAEIARILKLEGHAVRLATSRRAEAGGEKVWLDQASGEGVHEAFAGIDRAFFLSPSGYADQYAMLSPLIQEAKRCGLQKVVLLSAMGANAVETSPLRRAELELERSGLSYGILRPNWFMQNFQSFWIHGIRADGMIQVPAGTAKTSFIDTRDIAAVAARLLVDDSHGNGAFELTGPEALDHAQVAARISSATGRKVGYQEIAPETLRNGLLQGGVRADYADFLLLIFGFLREGYNARTTDSVERILGRPPRSFEAYAADHRAVLQ